MIKVLIVEDSAEMQIILNRILSNLGTEVFLASTITEAKALLLKIQPRLIILDICLPDGDGFQFCAQLSEHEETRAIPFIFISGKEDVANKVAAFSIGAEDYIVKPFNPMELKARLSAHLKKIISL